MPDTRSTLLDVALELFVRHGYEAVSVQSICDAAHVTKPTLYHHFGSKRGLLEALVADRFDSYLTAFEEAARYDGRLPATLERVVAATFAFACDDPNACRLRLALWFGPAESEALAVAAALDARQQEALEGLFRGAVRDHGNMRGRHRRYAASLLGTIHAYVGLGLRGRVGLDARLAHDVVHQFSHGIYS
jgi:AcrR family transcriptional regulator